MRNQFSFTLAIAAISLLANAARAEDEHRELGPHVHGHGTLNIAIEDKRVSMELEVPGMDIVGFEHAPSTADQKAAVDKATARLEKPLEVFSLPTAAGCTVAEAKVSVEAEHHHDGETMMTTTPTTGTAPRTTSVTTSTLATTSFTSTTRSTARARRS